MNCLKEPIETLVDTLEKAFAQSDVDKSEIVRAIKGYLPNFEHLETGRNLDSKM